MGTEGEAEAEEEVPREAEEPDGVATPEPAVWAVAALAASTVVLAGLPLLLPILLLGVLVPSLSPTRPRLSRWRTFSTSPNSAARKSSELRLRLGWSAWMALKMRVWRRSRAEDASVRSCAIRGKPDSR